jgi:hypothetical protein
VPQVGDVRSVIQGEIGEELASLGLSPADDGAFAMQRLNVLQMACVSFLDQAHAGRFNTSTASFSLELGVLFPFIPTVSGAVASIDPPPPIHQCHVRTILTRQIAQVAPAKIRFSVSGRRKDIWWVDAAGTATREVVIDARAQLRRLAPLWLDRFSGIPFVIRYLQWAPSWWPGAPFGIGARGSPLRRRLIAALQ